MIDPQFMDETLGIDRKKIAERYKQVNQPNETHGEQKEVEQEQPQVQSPQEERQIQFNVSYENGADEFNREEMQEQVEESFQPTPPLPEWPQQQQQYEEPPRPKIGRPGKAIATDGPIFAGGPLESEILAWKKQFGRIYSTELDGDIYIWRTINRFEYKEVMSAPNTNELMREEMICEVCVLFPYDYSYESMVNEPGGIPSMLSEQIMQKSGFTRRAKISLL